MNKDNKNSRDQATFTALVERNNLELQSYWTRNNIFLVVNMGLLGLGFASSLRNPILDTLLTLIGISSAVLWFVVAQRGRAWLHFWENRAAKLESNLPEPKMFPRPWFDEESGTRIKGPKPITTLIYPLPALVIIAWLILWIVYFFELGKQGGQGLS